MAGASMHADSFLAPYGYASRASLEGRLGVVFVAVGVLAAFFGALGLRYPRRASLAVLICAAAIGGAAGWSMRLAPVDTPIIVSVLCLVASCGLLTAARDHP